MKYFGFILLDLVFLGIVVAITIVAFHGDSKRAFIGVLCATFTIAMYAAPLTAVVRKGCIVKNLCNFCYCCLSFSIIVLVQARVIRTKSIKYMPFFLSFSLVVNAAVWFTFAMLLKDYYVLVSFPKVVPALFLIINCNEVIIFF